MKKNIFIREVRTIYTFIGKTVLKCITNVKEIFRKLLLMINNIKVLELDFN